MERLRRMVCMVRRCTQWTCMGSADQKARWTSKGGQALAWASVGSILVRDLGLALDLAYSGLDLFWVLYWVWPVLGLNDGF